MKTLEFIKKKCSFNYHNDNKGSFQTIFFTNKNGPESLIVIHTKNYKSFKSVASAAVSDFNSSLIGVRGTCITIGTTEKRKVRKEVYESVDNGKTWHNTDVYPGGSRNFSNMIIEASLDDIPEVAKAFKWLIAYCGGRGRMY